MVVSVKLSLPDKHFLYHDLGQFLRSGIPLPQAVEALLPDTAQRGVRQVLKQLLKMFLQGESVPGAFARLKPTVGDMEVALIEASSNTGRLDQAFSYLAEYFGALEFLRAKIVRAILWPAIQLHLGVLIPNLVPLFVGGMTDAAWHTYFVRCGTTLAIFYVVGIGLWALADLLISMARSSATVDGILSWIPLVGKLRRNLSLSRFCATYEMQLQGGINVYDSLRAASDASQSGRLQAFIKRVLPQVRGGASFGSTLTGKGALPSALQRAIRVGEDTGNLDENLKRWADYYQKASVGALDMAAVWIPRVFYFLIAGYLVYCILGAGQDYAKSMQGIIDGAM